MKMKYSENVFNMISLISLVDRNPIAEINMTLNKYSMAGHSSSYIGDERSFFFSKRHISYSIKKFNGVGEKGINEN